MATALSEVWMTAKAKPASWKGWGIFSFCVATVFFSGFSFINTA